GGWVGVSTRERPRGIVGTLTQRAVGQKPATSVGHGFRGELTVMMNTATASVTEILMWGAPECLAIRRGVTLLPGASPSSRARPRSGAAPSSALTQQAVSAPRWPVQNERRRRRPPPGRRTGTTGERPQRARGSPPAPPRDRRGPRPPRRD